MELVVKGLTQAFGTTTVLDRLDLTTGDIRALVLVGPSGGGKTTLLRILAGLDLAKAGSVSFAGVPVPRDEPGLLAYRRKVGTVFQAYNLFPHLSALDNLTLPLVHVHGLSPAAARKRVAEPLERFKLAEHGVVCVDLGGGEDGKGKLSAQVAAVGADAFRESGGGLDVGGVVHRDERLERSVAGDAPRRADIAAGGVEGEETWEAAGAFHVGVDRAAHAVFAF